MRRIFLVLLAVLATRADAGEYRAVQHHVGKIHLYRAAPRELSLHWKGGDGKPMRTFARLQEELAKDGKRPVFLMNAGIFEPGGIPPGLHVQDGVELLPLNLDPGKGNFFLKPNGVFFIDDEGAHVMESTAYAEAAPVPRLALQSGPLLLADGKPHPAFNIGSSSKLHRNGVGVLPDGRVLFIMTDIKANTRVNLWTFAQLFREYGCQDALFLDGDLSILRVAGSESLEGEADRELAPGVAASNHFGAILAVVVEGEE